MRPPAFLLLAALCVPAIAAEPAAMPDTGMLRLEAALTQKLEERKSGTLPPDQYRRFAAKFRADLDAALARAPETPVNRGRHAMILARLDESGLGQAIAGLDQALVADPGSAELLLAKGSIQLEQGDYAGALASADAVLKGNAERGEEPYPAAVSLRYFSKGRGAAVAGKLAGAARPPGPGATEVTDPNGRPAIQFTPQQARAKVEVPSIAADGAPGVGPGTESSGPGYIDRSLAWTQAKIEGAQQGFVKWAGRNVGLRTGEEEAALKGSMDGAILGTGIGVVLGAVGGGMHCLPGAVTGGPYLKCILAGGAGGILVGAPTGAVIGGTYAVAHKRSMAQIDKLQGKEPDSE